MRVSIIVPVYNEASTVAEVLERLPALPFDKEIIVVNDGSTDGTKAALQPFETRAGYQVHHSPVNLGKGSSVRIGFGMATGDIITIQDADLELDPFEYPRLIEPVANGSAQVVYGSRFLEGGKKGHWAFYLANRTLSGLTNVLYGSRLTDIETCYKVLRRDVLEKLVLRGSRFEIEPELTAQLLKAGVTITELPISYNPRSRAQGKKISWRDGVAAVAMLVSQRLG